MALVFPWMARYPSIPFQLFFCFFVRCTRQPVTNFFAVGALANHSLMTLPSVEELKSFYNLREHPEGGLFVQSFKSNAAVQTEANTTRSSCTAIYFLLPKDSCSRFHRLKSDEVWHFYVGGPLTVVELDEETKLPRTTVLGQDVLNGQKFQYVVRANTWFGAFPNEGSEYSFVGCTVAPGFEYIDFEIGQKQQLLKDFPAASSFINKLTVQEQPEGLQKKKETQLLH